MPRQFYSDKYIKHMRGAEKAEDNMQRSKAVAQQAMSEEREAERHFNREAAQEAKEQAKDESNQAMDVDKPTLQ